MRRLRSFPTHVGATRGTCHAATWTRLATTEREIIGNPASHHLRLSSQPHFPALVAGRRDNMTTRVEHDSRRNTKHTAKNGKLNLNQNVNRFA